MQIHSFHTIISGQFFRYTTLHLTCRQPGFLFKTAIARVKIAWFVLWTKNKIFQRNFSWRSLELGNTILWAVHESHAKRAATREQIILSNVSAQSCVESNHLQDASSAPRARNILFPNSCLKLMLVSNFVIETATEQHQAILTAAREWESAQELLPKVPP